jgi:hypothetical protein
MEQEDYLKRQIDQLGRVLGKALSDLLGLVKKGQAGLGVETTVQTIKTELDLDIGELTDIKTENFIKTLQTEKKFTNAHLEKLAEILFLLADHKPATDQKNINEKCLAIYEYLENAESTYSFDRQRKIKQIKGRF